MKFHFSRKSDFRNLPLGTIVEVEIYYGEGDNACNRVDLKKIDTDTWEFLANKYGYEGTRTDEFIYNNQHKYMLKDAFYLMIPNTRFDMHPMYLIRGDWYMEYEFIYLEQILNDNKLDKEYTIKFGVGEDNEWIVNLVSTRDRSRKFWCTLTNDEKKALEEKYGKLANTFNTYL